MPDHHLLHPPEGFNTQPPEGGWLVSEVQRFLSGVSTHSRPKAAGVYVDGCGFTRSCFNTQPPEGGWALFKSRNQTDVLFQHTAARRRLVHAFEDNRSESTVSTHSRPKAAGAIKRQTRAYSLSFNTQPPEGGWPTASPPHAANRGFNTQPPEGGWLRRPLSACCFDRFNTQPPEGGWHTTRVYLIRLVVSTHSRPKAAGACGQSGIQSKTFQHTAARRRLACLVFVGAVHAFVSTHSRPKAAGFDGPFPIACIERFNTQPPEGGWLSGRSWQPEQDAFQHTAARRRLELYLVVCVHQQLFQHTAARRRLAERPVVATGTGRFQHTAARRRLAGTPARQSRNHGFNTQPPEGGWQV